MVALQRFRGFFKSAERTNVEKTETISTLKHLSWMKYFFQKLTQFQQRNNVLKAAATNTDYFLWTDTHVSSTQLNRPTQKKMSLSP
jgi:hypothetical protein